MQTNSFSTFVFMRQRGWRKFWNSGKLKQCELPFTFPAESRSNGLFWTFKRM